MRRKNSITFKSRHFF